VGSPLGCERSEVPHDHLLLVDDRGP
jgi:hypothetical protein